jgi:hypothetical protein
MPAKDAPTRPIGTLGGGNTGFYDSWWGDVIEHVPDLQYPISVRTFARMRHDPTLTSVLAAYTGPIRSAPWHVDPAGASAKMTKVVADSLGLPILGSTAKPGARRQRGVRWRDHLRLALLHLTYGHMIFEPVYEVDGDAAYLAELPERMPHSVSMLWVDQATGEFQGISQNHSQARAVNVTSPEIAADRLLMYVHDREGSAWFGRSLLRPAFGSWLFKQDTLRVHATSLRRFGAGTPTMEPLAGYTPTAAEIQQAARAAAAVRVGDTGGVTTPGFTLRIKGVEGDIPDAMPFLRYLDEQMAREALTSVLDLGSTATGSRALGTAFLDVLGQALQAAAEEIADTATGSLAAKIVEFNEGPDAAVPQIVVGDVGASEKALAQTVATLVQAGALSMDDDLEAWVRDVFDLPARTTPRPAPPAPGQLPATGPATGPAPRWVRTSPTQTGHR